MIATLRRDLPSEDPIDVRFDETFSQKTSFATLNQTLARIAKSKAQLLRVLERPDIPLYTNGSESDIRDYVKKNKVSGGTHSNLGQQCRDTFASNKKTCRKLGISFWAYVLDRVSRSKAIPHWLSSSSSELPLPEHRPALLESYETSRSGWLFSFESGSDW